MGYRQLKTRLAKLECQLPKPQTAEDHHDGKWRRQVARRLARLCEKAGRLMTEEEFEKLDQALGQWIESEQGPYALWFGDLLRGHCRLPALEPELMKDLLLAWLSPACDRFACVCRRCGLVVPASPLASSE